MVWATAYMEIATVGFVFPPTVRLPTPQNPNSRERMITTFRCLSYEFLSVLIAVTNFLHDAPHTLLLTGFRSRLFSHLTSIPYVEKFAPRISIAQNRVAII
jgi:hypothetical protein